jgi:phosphoenolpyruvate carboxykinase (ATP)
MAIKVTRALIDAVLGGKLSQGEMREDPLFGFQVPKAAPGVPSEVLNPRDTWSDKSAYDVKAKELANRFVENFKQFEGAQGDAVKSGGPRM